MIKAVIFDMYETLITLYAGMRYTRTQISADAGISEAKFVEIWDASDSDRTVGKVTFEEILGQILRANGCYSEEKIKLIAGKRTRSREDAFEHLHEGILPMLSGLKERGVLIGLISNCYSEEAVVIKNSVLYPFFDAVCLSYDEGLAKPNPDIYLRCMQKLNVRAEDCLYIGDGGSDELEAAQRIGMQTAQAVWYMNDGTRQLVKSKSRFRQLEAPEEVLGLVDEV